MRKPVLVLLTIALLCMILAVPALGASTGTSTDVTTTDTTDQSNTSSGSTQEETPKTNKGSGTGGIEIPEPNLQANIKGAKSEDMGNAISRIGMGMYNVMSKAVDGWFIFVLGGLGIAFFVGLILGWARKVIAAMGVAIIGIILVKYSPLIYVLIIEQMNNSISAM